MTSKRADQTIQYLNNRVPLLDPPPTPAGTARSNGHTFGTHNENTSYAHNTGVNLSLKGQILDQVFA